MATHSIHLCRRGRRHLSEQGEERYSDENIPGCRVNVQNRSKGELRGSVLQCIDCHISRSRLVIMKIGDNKEKLSKCVVITAGGRK